MSNINVDPEIIKKIVNRWVTAQNDFGNDDLDPEDDDDIEDYYYDE